MTQSRVGKPVVATAAASIAAGLVALVTSLVPAHAVVPPRSDFSVTVSAHTCFTPRARIPIVVSGVRANSRVFIEGKGLTSKSFKSNEHGVMRARLLGPEGVSGAGSFVVSPLRVIAQAPAGEAEEQASYLLATHAACRRLLHR
jgi:hypothetical protein